MTAGDQGEAKGGKRVIRTVASACDSRLTISTFNLVNVPNSLTLSCLADRRSFSVLTVQTPLIYTPHPPDIFISHISS